jgi:soluble lytic murein transglycosylase-like protein
MENLVLSVLALQLRLAQISLERMAVPVEAAEMMPADYRAYASSTAIDLGVDPVKFTRTLECESHYDPDAVGKLGELGIAQIYPKYHLDVTREEALDGIWAIHWAALQFSQGNEHLWSCYNRIYGK